MLAAVSLPPDLKIRTASAADAAVLAALRNATFIEAFGHLYRPEDLNSFCERTHSESATAQMLEQPGVTVWLAELHGRALGFATVGPCKLPVPQLEATAGELRQLYVLAQTQGSGLGTRLLERALAWLDQQGHTPIYVGVWSENYGAQRLYARYGFGEKVGEYDFPVGAQLDREFIYRRAGQ
jgi:GNAT superfamily N-acetyltransferase